MAADLSRGKSVGDALNIGKSAVVNKACRLLYRMLFLYRTDGDDVYRTRV